MSKHFAHPFVTIFKSETGYRATWMPPGTKYLRSVRFKDIGILSPEARRAWAIRKSAELSAEHSARAKT